MNGSFLNSGSDSTAALLAQMTGGGNSGNSSAPTGGSVPPFKTSAPIVPAPAPESEPEPEPERASPPTSTPEPVHATASPTAKKIQAAAPSPVSAPGPAPAAVFVRAPAPIIEPGRRSIVAAVDPDAEPEPEADPGPDPIQAEDAEPTPVMEPTPVVERSPRAPEPEPAPTPAPPVRTPPAKAAAPPRTPRRAAPPPPSPVATAPAPAVPTTAVEEEAPTAHGSLLESFLDARINSKGWETWGFRLLPDVKSRLGRRLTADKRSSQNRRLALGHYLNAALLELPEDNEEQIEMIRSFLRARGGITDPSQSSSYRVSPAVYELARDLDTELTATEKRGLVVYLFSAAVELFLDRLDTEGALARPDIFAPQQ
jgi:hypothetical protein